MGFFSFFQKRRQQMREMAEYLGMDFQLRDEYGLIGMLKDFKLFRRGYGKKVYHILSNQRDISQADFRVFDYKYVVGGGNSTRTIRQTVFYVHSKELNLPELLIKPETFFHRIGEWMGMQDIDFVTHPNFSKQYLVQGPEEDLIRNSLNDEVLRHFTLEKNWSVEGLNYMLIFYKSGRRIPPDQIADFYKKGMHVFELLKMNKKDI